jgi:UDP-2,3-diacylglucosamine pyrophosphatase LpxH
METVIADTLLISDLHLGSETSRALEATLFLRSAVFNRLILLGDIFCDLNFRRLKKEHWQFLSLIRKLSNPKRGVEVVWVEGNHDRGLAQLMSHLVGVEVYEEYAWQHRGVKYRGIHGHQFDRFLVDSALLSAVGEFIYLHIQKIDFQDSKIARWLDRLNSRWLRLTPKVARGALALARSRGDDVVFCGHTHQAFYAQSDGVRYFNTGAWTHECLTYVAVDDNGARLGEYVPHCRDFQVGNCHPDEPEAEVSSEPLSPAC